MAIGIRLCLALVFLVELMVGLWNQLFPLSFYHSFPTVDLTPPFSEHFARDFGGATLGIAFLLLLAVIRPRTVFVVPAAVAFLIYAVPHFFFHFTHMAMATPAQMVFLTVGNASVVVLAAAAIALAVARDRRGRADSVVAARP